MRIFDAQEAFQVGLVDFYSFLAIEICFENIFAFEYIKDLDDGVFCPGCLKIAEGARLCHGCRL